MPSGDQTFLLQYGKSGYRLSLPGDWDVHEIRKRPMLVLSDPADALNNAFARPIGSAPLKDAATGKRSACILICDNTRPVPNGLILPPLIRHLLDAGLADEAITILVATGLHDPLSESDLDALVGDQWVRQTVAVCNHDAKFTDDHVPLGHTDNGIPIKLDRRFVDAEVKIVVGLVEPHFMAGYSGGRKLIVPGVAAAETIGHVHSYRMMAHPNADNCIIDGNPLHEEQLSSIRSLGDTYAVNVVLDEARKVCFINYGEIVQSHLQAVEFFRPYSEIAIDQPFSTVITTAAGHPLDASYYQTIKGMVAAKAALAKGGKMFIASSCSKGFGSDGFVDAQRRLVSLGVEGFLADLSKKPTADIDEWQTQLLTRTLKRGSVCLYTNGLTQNELSMTGIEATDDLESALTEWMANCKDKRVAVIPEGPYVIPRKPLG